jgi:hypothetical protein
MNELDKIRNKKLTIDIGTKLFKLTKHKEKICLVSLAKEKEQEDDLFYFLCTCYGYMYFGDRRSEFFDNRKVDTKDLYSKFDMIILLDGERNCKKKDVKLSVIDMKTLKMTFQTDSIFTNEICDFLKLHFLREFYERLPQGEKTKNGLQYKTKKKYKYLFE